jgi:hypothetical protein
MENQQRQYRPWADVVKDERFTALEPQQQEEARRDYFNANIAPKVPEQERESVAAQFDQHSLSLMPKPMQQAPEPQQRPQQSAEPAQRRAQPTLPNGEGVYAQRDRGLAIPGENYDSFTEATGKSLENVPERLQQSVAGMIQMQGESMAQYRDMDIDRRAATRYGVSPEDMRLLAWAGNEGLVDPKADFKDVLPQLKQEIGALDDRQLTQLSESGMINPADMVEYGKKWRADTEATMEDVNAKPGSAGYYGSAIIGSLAEMAPMIATSIITRSPKIAGGVMMGQVGGQSYAEGREEGLSPEQARVYATLSAASEAIPEAVVVGQLLKRAGGSLLGAAAKGAEMEAYQEGLTGILQAGIDQQMIDPDMTAREALERIRDGIIIGAGSGAGMGAAIGAANNATAGSEANDNSPGAQLGRLMESELAASESANGVNYGMTRGESGQTAGRPAETSGLIIPTNEEPEKEQATPAPKAKPQAGLQTPGDLRATNPVYDQQQTAAPVNEGDNGTGVFRVKTDDIKVDPEAYQFRTEVNTEGTDKRLDGIEKWDDNRAGNVILHRRKDGSLYVADGHHRVGLAKRLKQGDINARIYDEADGYTTADVRREAAMINIAADSATPVDVAKVFRDSDVAPDKVQKTYNLPNSQVTRDGRDLAILGDNVFGMVASGQLDAKDGAAIGRGLPEAAQQEEAARIFQNVKPQNESQRQMLVADIRNADFMEQQSEQGGLFGDDTQQVSLLQNRLKVMDKLRQNLASDKNLFRTLNANADRATEAGNQINADANSEISESAQRNIDMLGRVTTTPALNAMVNDAARKMAEGESMASVVSQLKKEILSYGNDRETSGKSAPDAGGQQAVRAGNDARTGQRVSGKNADRGNGQGQRRTSGEKEQPSQEVDDDFALQPQTEQDLQEQERKQQEADKTKSSQRKQEEDRAQADSEVDDFSLTGSNRTADVAAAAGQTDLLAPEQPSSTQDPDNDAAQSGAAQTDNVQSPTKKQVVSTAPEHSAIGVDPRELDEIVTEFNDAQQSMIEDGEAIHHLFDKVKKKEIVRLGKKAGVTQSKKTTVVKGKKVGKVVYNRDAGWMTPAEAKARIAEWKKHALDQYDTHRIANNDRVVLSLFDLTGKWSQPWEDAGYQVYRFDIQNDPDVGDINNFSTEFFGDWFGDFDGNDVYAILAATPCTDFASSGSKHFAAKDEDGRTVASVKLVHQTLAAIEYFKPAVWAMENPVGRIEKLGGLPPWRLSFDPFHIGDPYTKKTLLWGRFNADMPVAPVEPTDGSKMHSKYGGKSLATKNARSATPEGFSYGFFMANNAVDHPVMAIANKYDRLDPKLIEQAVNAGITESQISEVVDDPYYFELDDEAGNQAIRDLIKEGPIEQDPQLELDSMIDALSDAQATEAAEAIGLRVKGNQDPRDLIKREQPEDQRQALAAVSNVAQLDDRTGSLFRRSGSAATTISRADANKAVVGAIGEATVARRFRFVEFDTLPAPILQAASDQGMDPSEVKAVHWRGNTYMVDNRFTSTQDAKRTAFHEHYVHFGLRAKYGIGKRARMSSLLAGVGGLKGVRTLADKQGINLSDYAKGLFQDQSATYEDRSLVLMEELMAHMGESTGKLKRLIEEFIGQVRAWVRNNGYANLADLGVTDLAYELRMARHAAQQADQEVEADRPMFARKPAVEKPEGANAVTGNLAKVNPSVRDAVNEFIGRKDEAEQQRIRDNLQQHEGTSWAAAAVKGMAYREMLHRITEKRNTDELEVNAIWGKQDMSKTSIVRAMKAGPAAIKKLVNAYDFLGSNRKAENDVSTSFANCNPSTACAKFCYAAGSNARPSEIAKSEFTEFMLETRMSEVVDSIAADYDSKQAGKTGLALRINDKGDLSKAQVQLIGSLNDKGIRVQIFTKRPDLLDGISDFNLKMLSIDTTNFDVAMQYPDTQLAVTITDDMTEAMLQQINHRVAVYLPVNLKGKAWTKADMRKKFPGLFTKMNNKICPVDGGGKKTLPGTSFVDIVDRTAKTDVWTCTACDKYGAAGCFNGDRQTNKVRAGSLLASDNGDRQAVIKARDEALKNIETLLKLGAIDGRAYEKIRAAVTEGSSDLWSDVKQTREYQNAAEGAETLGREGAGRGGDGRADSPERVEEPGLAYADQEGTGELGVEARRAQSSPDQITLDFSTPESIEAAGNVDPYQSAGTRAGTTEAQREVGRSALRDLFRQLTARYRRRSPGRDPRGEISLLGSTMYRNFAEGKPNQLIGQRVNDGADLAAIAQVYRDPRFETFRVVMTRNGDVVSEFGISSRLPAMVRFADTVTSDVAKAMREAGADSFFMMHNHPSGKSNPSPADERATIKFAKDIPGFKGHVVIDHNEYSMIDKDGRHYTVQAPEFDSMDFKTDMEQPHAALGISISSPFGVAEAAKRIEAREGEAILISTAGGKNEINLIASIPLNFLEAAGAERTEALAALRRLRRAAGSGGHAFVVLPGDTVPPYKYNWLMYTGAVSDVTTRNGDSMAQSGQRQGADPTTAKPQVLRVGERSRYYDPQAGALLEEIERLAPQVEQAYENGSANAEQLDAQLEEAYQRLEDTLSAIEEDVSNVAEDSAPYGTDAFRRWFGDSKVVDAQGNPLVVYHGAPDGRFIDEDGTFKSERDRFGMGRSTGVNWFAASKATAKTYANDSRAFDYQSAEPRIIEAYLKLENPLMVDAAGKQWREAQQRGKTSDVIEQAIAEGRDGLIIRRVRDNYQGNERSAPTDTFVVFSSSQIKSATDNNGDFDSGNDDIRFARRARDTSATQPFPIPGVQQDSPIVNVPPRQETMDATSDRAPIALPDETRFQKAQRLAQDKLNRFTVLNEWLAERGIILPEAADVFRTEERMHGRYANKAKDFREKTVLPMVKRIQQAGFKMEEVAQVLHAQHAFERNAQIRKVNSKVRSGSGMNDAEAMEILAGADRKLIGLANEFRRITDMTREVLVRSGLLSVDQSEAWQNTYQNYVPLKGGPSQKPAQMTGTGKGLSTKYKPKRALGHDVREEGEFIIENMLSDHERALMLSEKNRVGQALLRLAKEIAMPDLLSIGQPEKRAVLQNKTAYEVLYKGSVIEVFNSLEAAETYRSNAPFIYRKVSPGDFTMRTSRDPSVVYMASPIPGPNEALVYVAGNMIRIQIKDDLLARAFNNQGAEQMNTLLQMGRSLNNYFSRVYTGYNPEFIITNVVRDFSSGLLNMTADEGVGFSGKVMTRYVSSFGSLLNYGATNEPGKWISMYREDGGNTGAAYLNDLERLGKDVLAEYSAYKGVMANLGQGDMKGAARAAGRKVFNRSLRLIEILNEAGENAMRLAVYRAAVESGRSRETAASLAKNATVNFNRKGEKGAEANALYLFFNAATQGTARIAQGLVKGKHKGQAWGLLGGMAMLGYSMAMLVGGSDEDDYEKLPDYVRERNMVIRAGDGWVTVPVPYGHGFAWNLGRIIADAQRTGEWGKLPWHLASSFMTEITPFGGMFAGEKPDAQQAFQFALPTAAQIAAVPVNNLTSFGSPLYPENPFDEGEPDQLKMWRGTQGTWADRLAGTMAEFGLEITPETLKHLGRTFTGGAGTMVSGTVNAAILGANQVAPEASETPFVRRFYQRNDVRDSRGQFWSAVTQVKAAQSDLRRAKKAADWEAQARIREEKGELLVLNKTAQAFIKMSKASRDRVEEIRLNEKMPLAEQRRQIKKMEEEEAKVYDSFVKLFKEGTRE